MGASIAFLDWFATLAGAWFGFSAKLRGPTRRVCSLSNRTRRCVGFLRSCIARRSEPPRMERAGVVFIRWWWDARRSWRRRILPRFVHLRTRTFPRATWAILRGTATSSSAPLARQVLPLRLARCFAAASNTSVRSALRVFPFARSRKRLLRTVFCTYPRRRSCSAFMHVYLRKKTPCTRP